jgi:transcriptional regulator with XRE-family HTH domain
MTVQELNTLFGKNVRQYRKNKSWSQTRLAKEIGTDQGTVSFYELGKNLASGKQLVLLAYVLGVDVWQLFYDGEIK